MDNILEINSHIDMDNFPMIEYILNGETISKVHVLYNDQGNAIIKIAKTLGCIVLENITQLDGTVDTWQTMNAK